MRPAQLCALAAVSIATAVAATYLGMLHAPFLGLDLPTIVGNVSLRGGLASAFFDTWQGGRMVWGRPVLNLSFALNYWLGGTAVGGYHAVNVLLHLGSALLLFGIVRRCCKNQLLLAWACALLWAVHPLQTSAVTYTVQRAESLSAFFALGAFYAFLRGVESPSAAPRVSALWLSIFVAANWLGMGTNEIMISIPFVIMLYDRTFLCPSWKEVLRQRWAWHAFALISILWQLRLAAESHHRGGSYGWTVVPWPKYAAAQYPAFLLYLKLTFWPHPLVLDYGNRYVASGWEVLPGAVPFALCTVAALTTFWRPTAMSFLAVTFLEILEPTSVMPYLRQTTAEHRMYLALAPLLFALLWGLQWLLRRWTSPKRSAWILAGTVAAAAVALGATSAHRNQEYLNSSHLADG